MARSPRKNPIKTKPIPSLGSGIELVVWESPIGNYSIELEDWQVEAIQQVLGLRYDFDTSIATFFAPHEVEKRVKEMGRLVLVVDE